MKVARSITATLLAAGLAAACTSTADSEDTPTPEPSVTATDGPPDHSAPVLPEFEVIDGFSENPDLEFPFQLDYQNAATAYQLDGAAENNAIFITAYLLPEDVPADDYEQRVELVAQYNEVSANEVENLNTSESLTHGYPGVFRYAVVRDADDMPAYQRNFFVFDGRLMVHLSCQWQDQSDAVRAACTDLSTTFTIPSE